MPRYYTVKLCIALQSPGFTGFLAEGLEKPNFDVIFSKWNNKSLIRWLNIYRRADIFLIAHFAYYHATCKISARVIC